MVRIYFSIIFVVCLLESNGVAVTAAAAESESSMFDAVAQMMFTQFSAYLSPKKASDGNVGIVSKSGSPTHSASTTTTSTTPAPVKTENVSFLNSWFSNQ